MRIRTISKCKIFTYTIASILILTLITVPVYVFLIKETTNNEITAAIVTNGYGCSDIGKSIFSKGGSVADAAIAALFCEGVSMPQSMGLGGGFLLTIYDKARGKMRFLNARETAPKSANETMFNGNSTLSQLGGLATAVPGELKGYWYLYKEYGSLPWKDLVQPTIDLCKNGIYVTALLAKVFAAKREFLYADLVLRESFIDPETNQTHKEGHYVKRLRLAQTLEIIAKEGADALYSINGSLIHDFVQDIQDNNGIITVDDLLEYEPIWEEPLSANLSDGYSLHTASLPGSGAVLTYLLNILDGFMDLNDLYNVKNFQRIVESFKFAYGSRTKLGDDKLENVTEVIKNMTSKKFAEETRKLISDTKTSQDFSYYGAETEGFKDHGTAHISILAPNGDAISVTSTINFVFGARYASKSTGIILNNEMDDFSSPNIISGYNIPPSPKNFIKPGKRPLSSMVPTIILKDNKDVKLITGAAGGSKITTVVASIIIKQLWFGINLDKATKEKRIHHQLFPMEIEYEEDFDLVFPEIVQNLTLIGHKSVFTPSSDGFSAVTSISTLNEEIVGAYDDRRCGFITYF